MPKKFSYSKKEKVKGRKLIERLFTEGKSFTIFPIKTFYLPLDEKMDSPARAGVGAGSKNFPKAVQRNRIKRLLREAYRTEKLPLLEYLYQHSRQVALFMIYIDKTMPEYSLIKNKMPFIIQRLIRELHENNS